VSHSNRYIPDRFLPDKAIDLVDEAGARVKLRQTSQPEEITEVQKRIKFIVHRMRTRSRTMSSKRLASTPMKTQGSAENLALLREKYHLMSLQRAWSAGRTSRMWFRAGLAFPSLSIKEEETQKLLRIEEELHKRIISKIKSISALARAIRRSRAG